VASSLGGVYLFEEPLLHTEDTETDTNSDSTTGDTNPDSDNSTDGDNPSDSTPLPEIFSSSFMRDRDKNILLGSHASSMKGIDQKESDASNGDTNHLTDGDITTRTFPGISPGVDLLITLPLPTLITSIGIYVGEYGYRNTEGNTFIQNWILQGETLSHEWITLGEGGIPEKEYILFDTMVIVEKLRLTTTGYHWSGVYEIVGTGVRDTLQGLYVSSLIPQHPIEMLANKGNASHLTDGDINSWSFPGDRRIYNQIILPHELSFKRFAIVWNTMGYLAEYNNETQVGSWTLRGDTIDGLSTIAYGGVPNEELTLIELEEPFTTRVIELETQGYNWHGVYELVAEGGAPLGGDSITEILGKGFENIIKGSSVLSLTGEDPVWTPIIQGDANHLTDGDLSTVAFPGLGPETEYEITLSNPTYVRDLVVYLGEYGDISPDNATYVGSYSLTGETPSHERILLEEGGIPRSTFIRVKVEQILTKIYISTEGRNWHGIYEIMGTGFVDTLVGEETISLISGNSYWREVVGGDTSHLSDGDLSTQAWIGGNTLDYEIVLPKERVFSEFLITWGKYGDVETLSNAPYVEWWGLEADTPSGWVTLRTGGIPRNPETLITLQSPVSTRVLRLTSGGYHWFGVYEVMGR